MNNQGTLYRAGLRPVFRVTPKTQKKWRRLPNPVEYGKGEEGYQVTWSHSLVYNLNEEGKVSSEQETYFFAFSYPFSLEESLKQSHRLYKKYISSETIYLHKEILCLSVEQRPMELLTLTGRDDKLNLEEREQVIEGLFPFYDPDNEPRPYAVKKPTVFLTARVHPGESPASFVLNGIINFLLNEKLEQSRILRERFVFKIIPILNPDGVYRGYYRHDTKNQNLNRYYLEPTSEDQPTIWATKKTIL